MDRLTEHNVYFDGQHGFLAKGFDAIEQRPFFRIIRQLALYEDTGREPNEIAALDYDVAMLKQSARHANELAVEINHLRAELEQVKAERDAAVEDLKIMALAMRESDELSEGCCFACICDAQNLPDGCILPYGECPGYETDDCFEWRGLEGQV